MGFAKSEFRDIAGTKEFGLVFSGDFSMDFAASRDFLWARDLGYRYSTGRYMLKMASAAVIQCSTKQVVVAALNYKAKYISFSIICKEDI